MEKRLRHGSVFALALLAAALLTPSSPAAAASADEAAVGGVVLVSSDVVEIEYGAPVLSDEEAHELFTVAVDGAEAEWEYLSYFDFGPYAERGGVVNIRLKEALETGEPRIQRREVVLFEDTQAEKGPEAAARLTVNETAASWEPFFTEIQKGHMSQIDAWGSALAGNVEATGSTWRDNDAADIQFSAEPGSMVREYTTDYITKAVGEGINGMVGRAEYLNIPSINNGLVIHVVGGEQSVYEDPAWRELYVCGETEDVYARTGIGGNVEKPVIVTTADEVMRHDSDVQADGAPARVNDDFFQLGYDFLKLYYQFGIRQGSLCFPTGYNTNPDEYRYDLQLDAAFEHAKAENLWPGTVMMEDVENYYIYGVLTHFEMIPESADGSWQADRFPVNTREELESYDNDLYRMIAGVHGRYHWFTGNNSQAFTDNDFTNDVLKNSHPWFWQSQVDNYDVNGVRPPLAIEHADIISDTQIEIKFNREISTITPAADPANWKVTLDGKEVTGTYEAEGWVYDDGWKWGTYEANRVGVDGGYAWRTITLHVVPEEGSLDNGKPYGSDFGGFTQEDIDERKVSNGGWIADDEQPGEYPLEFGQLVTLEDAIRDYGAGAVGEITVEYVGEDPILAWDGSAIEKGTTAEAAFNPWMGTVYRSPLTGFYIYADSVASLDSLEAAAHLYDSELTNNRSIHYDKTAGGDDLPTPEQMDAAAAPPNNRSDQRSAEALKESPILEEGHGVTYDNPGQRIADGSVKVGGGMQLIAGYTYSHHAAMQPTHRDQISNGFHVWLYVEGWGGSIFQADETMIQKDAQMTRYKNENLVYHEGGHGVDSFTEGEETYGQDMWADVTAAWITGIAYENGRTWWNQYNTEGAYLRNRDEYNSTGSTFFDSTMREQFMGINDGTWTPINAREELFRYDPYAFEVFKRLYYNGNLGLYYADENGVIQTGNPDYRVIPEDWEVLRDTYEEFADWTSEDNLIAWGCTISPIAKYDPYTGESHDKINWISWSTPNVWDITTNPNPAVPTNVKDFIGGVPYNEPDENGNNTINQEHPFFREGGVVKPERPAEIEALVAPVGGTVSDVTLTRRPVVVEFKLADYSGPVTIDNAPNCFELYVDGQHTHFYFWSFEENEDGTATVQVRVEWPIEEGAQIEVVPSEAE